VTKVQFDVRNVVVLNNYSFKKVTLSFKYVSEITIDIAIPVIDKRSARNLLDRTINAENTRIIKNNIPKINNEFFKRIKAYTGTIFSFQWSLIFDEIMT
jgi:hypothetical protein